MIKLSLYSSLLLFLLSACAKEVNIDIPGFKENFVIDGSIETGFPPIVFLSNSKDIYSPTNLDAYMNGFLTGAVISVSDGSNTVLLDEICTDNLPAGTEPFVSQMLGIPVAELANYHICAYTTFNSSIWGQVGKTYHLNVQYQGKTYTSSSTIDYPTALSNLYWKADKDYTDWGFSWATLADNPSKYDAYKWEVKVLYANGSGGGLSPTFKPTFNPVFDDEFFNGKTFNFFYENPVNTNDQTIAKEYRGYFHLGDTVVIKFSKMDAAVYNYMEKKYIQMGTNGNPFATPTNIPSNITGGALGVWAAYSPTYDTLICKP